MLHIDVPRPNKSDHHYEFRCPVSRDLWKPREIVRWGRSTRETGQARLRPELHFGFRARNYRIEHHEVWDSLYPVLRLLRNGGPVFARGYDQVRIRFLYPIPIQMVDFAINRARNLGFELLLQADTVDKRYDCPTQGHVLAFGGGKDSRLLLGNLRELGKTPLPVTAGAINAPDLPEARVVERYTEALADCVMPALMSRGRHYYFGSTLGETQHCTPWQQYYDMAATEPLGELSSLLRSLGVEMEATAPASCLPSSLAQGMLHQRYPVLYAHQRSTARNDLSEKNLHVSLCELHHGLSFEAHCDREVFLRLLHTFVNKPSASRDSFGFRNNRKPYDLEIRALIHRHQDHPLMASVRQHIPDHWHGAWIDHIHPRAVPGIRPEFLELYKQHAPTAEEAPQADRDLPFELRNKRTAQDVERGGRIL